MPKAAVRTLGIPRFGTRSWRIPSMLYWEKQKLNRIDAERADYPNCTAYQRRRRSIERRVARLEAEFRTLYEENRK